MDTCPARLPAITPQELFWIDSASRPHDQWRAGRRCAAALGFQGQLERFGRSERRAFLVDDQSVVARIEHTLAEGNPFAFASRPGLIALSARQSRQAGERDNGVRGSWPGSVVPVRCRGRVRGCDQPEYLRVATGHHPQSRFAPRLPRSLRAVLEPKSRRHHSD